MRREEGEREEGEREEGSEEESARCVLNECGRVGGRERMGEEGGGEGGKTIGAEEEDLCKLTLPHYHEF